MPKTLTACAVLCMAFTLNLACVEAEEKSSARIIEPRHPSESGAGNAEEVQKLAFNFRNTPWPEVLGWLAGEANLTLDLTDLPSGEFNYIDPREHSIAEALDVVNGYLLPRGFVTIRRHQFLAVLSLDNPVVATLIPAVPVSDLGNYGNHELVRVVVPVEGHTPGELAAQVESMLGPHGKATPLDASSSLILQGFGKPLRETVALLTGSVAPPTNDQLVFRSFQLQHMLASDAERQIQNLFGLSSNPYQTSMARRAAYEERRYAPPSSSRGHEQAQPQQGPAPLMAHLTMNMKISSLRETNTLLVTATPVAVDLIENILKSIDVKLSMDSGNVAAQTKPVLKVYTVKEADEDDVAETINAIMPGVVINEDSLHNAVHILATPSEHEEIEQLIRIIDGGEVSLMIEVIQLTRSDPVEMSKRLATLFANDDRERRPVITPETRNSSLVIRATEPQLVEIRKMLAAYGETLAAVPSSPVADRFRKLHLPSQHNAERVARVVQDLLDEDRDFEHSIRIVVPSEGASTTHRQHTPVPNGDSRVDSGQTPHSQRHPLEAVTEHRYSQVSLQGESPSPDTSTEDENTAPKVTIEVRDEELFLYSSDGQALDRVEQTIRDLVRQMPSRMEWTVFYLKAADVDQTASNLVELLREENSSSTALGIGSDDLLGEQVTRIVPDARTNALFISGPQSQIDQAARFLKLLDSTDLPESLRDRVPRSIPVEYADPDAVADIIRELYKDFMEDPVEKVRQLSRSDRERETLAALVSATRSHSSGQQPPGIRLTLAVDRESRSLLVSCNEHLFEQIRELVRERDEAAKNQRRSVRVLQLNELSSKQVGTMLKNMTPQISVKR